MLLTALLGIGSLANGSWQISTADTVAVIGVEGDRPVVADLRSPGSESAWCSDSPVPLIDHVWLQGKKVDSKWRFVRGSMSLHGTRLSLIFDDAGHGLELRSIWSARPGRGPIEHRIEIENRSKMPVTVPEQESLGLQNVRPGGDAAIWWTRRGASNALTEGGTFQTQVAPGMNLDLVSDHHDPRSPVPWLSIQVGTSRGLYVGWEFSGSGRVHAQQTTPGSLEVRAGLMPDFKTDVEPGETLPIPAAFVGCYKGDIDEGSYSLHRFILSYLRPKPPKSFPDPALILGLYLDAGADKATEADVLRCEQFTRSIGFEVFMPDAMWFPACGDWRWDPKRFPHGSKPIGDAVHRDGMKFGLWCAWDNGGVSEDPGALSVRGPYGHPDWFPVDLPSNWQPGPFYGVSACMASPEARAWAVKKTQQMVGDYGLEMLKTDVHPMISECIRTDHRHGYGTDVSYWSAEGVYEVWDKLRAKFPGVVLENCSGASHIKDFGVIQRCAYTTVTDTLSNLPDRAGIYDSTFVLPPSALLTYTYENGYNYPGDEIGPYLARSAMMTAWNLAPTNSKGWTDKNKEDIRACVHVYKSWIRPILQDCKVHHVLPRPDGKHWDGMFFWSSRLGHGTLFVFRPDSDAGEQTVRLAGLVPGRSYRVWSEDGRFQPVTRTGESLMSQGLDLRLDSRYSSDLVHARELGR